jgi:ATP:ADP antiporter, AAA family
MIGLVQFHENVNYSPMCGFHWNLSPVLPYAPTMQQLRHYLKRSFGIREEEATAAFLGAIAFCALLLAYYILRPVRDEMGVAGGVRSLPRLFLVTLSVTAMLTPVVGWLVGRFSREVFLPLVYRFFSLNLILFFGVLTWASSESHLLYAGRVFFVWVSVFNLFSMSLFWAFMVDGFGYQRSRRVFGIIAIGGTFGAILGSSLATTMVGVMGRNALLLVSIVFLEIAVRIILILSRKFQMLETEEEADTQRPKRGGILAGIQSTLKSPYLLAISAFLFFYSLSSTFLYFQKSAIVAQAFADREARVAYFAKIDLWTNLLTITGQLFILGRLLKRWGTGLVLAILPVVTIIGFFLLGMRPTLMVLVVFQVVRTASNYALSKPARESLFTVVDADSRYKAKSFIDTFVYRGGDAIGAGGFDLLTAAGASMAIISFAAIPLALVWLVVALYLGRKQKRLAGN